MVLYNSDILDGRKTKACQRLAIYRPYLAFMHHKITIIQGNSLSLFSSGRKEASLLRHIYRSVELTPIYSSHFDYRSSQAVADAFEIDTTKLWSSKMKQSIHILRFPLILDALKITLRLGLRFSAPSFLTNSCYNNQWLQFF